MSSEKTLLSLSDQVTLFPSTYISYLSCQETILSFTQPSVCLRYVASRASLWLQLPLSLPKSQAPEGQLWLNSRHTTLPLKAWTLVCASSPS